MVSQAVGDLRNLGAVAQTYDVCNVLFFSLLGSRALPDIFTVRDYYESD